MKQLIGIISVLFIFSCAGNSQKLTPDQFEAKLANSNVQLVDVRTPQEVANGHIGEALNINVNDPEFKQKIEKLDKNKPVLVYCAVGGRSNTAAGMLKQWGFKEVYDLAGGINAWKDAGKPVKK